MSKKNSSVNLKNGFSDFEDLSYIFLNFKSKLDQLNKNSYTVAVSGGPDSLALTALAKAYSYDEKCKIYFVLVDHNLRKNSSKEAKSVKELLKKHQINLNVLKNRNLISKNIQSQAREARYDLLTKFCKKKKIKIILTAHNLEDQVETFFIRLSRGSGLHGLSSMKQINKIKNNINVVRPLLDYKKIQLIKISKIVFSKYYDDPTNKNTKYLRTRIRNLKNSLEKSGINYDQIIKSIKNLASSRDTLDLYFSKIYKEIVTNRRNTIFINLKDFYSLNEEMKMRILQKAIKEITKSYYSPRSKKIENLIHQLKDEKNKKLLIKGCAIFREKNQITIKKEKNT